MPKPLPGMTLGAHLSARTELRTALLPRAMQSLEILQLTSLDLAARVERELEQNEVLERLEPDATEARDRRPVGGADRHELLNAVPAEGPGLFDHVREQVAWAGLPPDLAGAVLALAGFLDDRGFLSVPEAELAAHVGDAMLEDALDALRGLEPRGLGARDAVHALLLQVPEGDGDHDVIEALLLEHLDALQGGDLEGVAHRMGCAADEIAALVEGLAGLEARPCARFSGVAAPAIRPDVVVRLGSSGFDVRVDDSEIPAIGLNADYAAMASASDTDAGLRRYLRQKLTAGRDLIRAIDQRGTTLVRVVSRVLEAQRDFLAVGDPGLRPLSMAEVAEQLGVHASTVSRAVADKYVDTDRGLFPLRLFFETGVGASAGAGRRGVRQRVAELVAGEEPSRPLSDAALQDALGREGIDVARRTITQYRVELGIPSSRRRRASR